MTSFDAGDWLKNRKLRKDFDMDDHPRATFKLDRVSEVVRDGAKFTAKAEGTLRWRGKEVVLVLSRDRLRSTPAPRGDGDVRARHQAARPLRAAVLHVQDGGRGDGRGHRARSAGVKRALLLVVIVALGLRAPRARADRRRPVHVRPHDVRQRSTTATASRPISRDGRKATWCFALPPIKVGTQVAEVDAYFLGTDKTAPLIELQLKVRGCVEDEVDRWMRERFGPPIETKSTREYWKNSFLWARRAAERARARVIHFLPPSENAEIARLKDK